jgi:hypothetical protein
VVGFRLLAAAESLFGENTNPAGFLERDALVGVMGQGMSDLMR